VEERLGGGDAHENVCQLGSGGFAADGDAGGVAAEGRDVVLDPIERGDEVAEGVVGAAGVVGAEEGLEIEEAEDAKAIGDGDAEDALLGEDGAVVHGLEGVAAGKAAAVDPDVDGEGAFGGRGPEVEVEAVFAVVDAGFAGLHGGGGETGGVALGGPGFDGDGCAEAERADGRLGEGNAAEDGHAGGLLAAEGAGGGVEGDGGCIGEGVERGAKGEGSEGGGGEELAAREAWRHGV